MKKIIRILLLIIISITPLYVNAEQNNKVEVYYNIPANVTFQNEDLIIKEEINCGEKLLEPSHVEIDGYIFKGWYNGEKRWDFDNDIVSDNLTLVAKYLKEDSFYLTIIVDEENTIETSILNDIDVSNHLEDVEENDDVDIIFKVKDADNIITEDEKQIFEKTVENNSLVIGKYIELSLLMEINDDPSTIKEIHETNNKMKVELTIPENIRLSNRKYSILRMHDNEVEVIYEGFPSKDWKIAFETDKFSLYAIAYSENKENNANSPKTGDNIMIWIYTLIVSLIGLNILIKINKKTQNNK